MKLECDSIAKGVARFRTTRWTVVMISAQSQTRAGRAAFAELYQLYWYPLYTFARRGGHSAEDAQDLTQSFFLHLLEHGALTHVDRLELVDYLTAETIFDARCAMPLLDQAMTLLRQEYAHGKASTFETLMGFLGSSGSNNKLSYEEAANVLGVGVGAVRTLIHRLRKQYTRFLREEVDRTVSEPVEVQEEIHALCDALIAAEGRLGP